jgi:hypothetical protein
MKPIHWRVVQDGVACLACTGRPISAMRRRIKYSTIRAEVTCTGCLEHVRRELTRFIEGEERENR